MLRENCRLGMKVIFGRPNGEKTLGKVVKVNGARAKVETLEARGNKEKAGLKWSVPYSLMTPATPDEVAAAPAVPATPAPIADPVKAALLAACKLALTALLAKRFDTAAYDSHCTALEAAIALAEKTV